MTRIICMALNGHMGQVISGQVENDPGQEMAAGIDVADHEKQVPVLQVGRLPQCRNRCDRGGFSTERQWIICWIIM